MIIVIKILCAAVHKVFYSMRGNGDAKVTVVVRQITLRYSEYLDLSGSDKG